MVTPITRYRFAGTIGIAAAFLIPPSAGAAEVATVFVDLATKSVSLLDSRVYLPGGRVGFTKPNGLMVAASFYRLQSAVTRGDSLYYEKQKSINIVGLSFGREFYVASNLIFEPVLFLAASQSEVESRDYDVVDSRGGTNLIAEPAVALTLVMAKHARCHLGLGLLRSSGESGVDTGGSVTWAIGIQW